MIAVSILITWLVLAAAAFLTLSALGRAAARHDLEVQLGALGSGESPATPGWAEPLQPQRLRVRAQSEHSSHHLRIGLANASLEQAA